MFGRRIRIAAGICAHNEEDYVAYAIRGMYDFADVIAVSVDTGQGWGGESGELDRTLEIVRELPDPDGKIRLVVGEWSNETEQRNANLDAVRDCVDYYMIVDPDEIYTQEGLKRLRGYIAWRPHIGQFRMRFNTYWKINPVHIIDPPEPLKAYTITRVRPATHFVGLRRSSERWKCAIPRSVVVCHHFSYARPAEKVLRKIRSFSHRDDLVPNWYENVWLRWDEDHNLEDLHPMHPPEYKRAIPVEIDSLPEAMRDHPFVRPKILGPIP